MTRVEDIDLPGLRQLESEVPWFTLIQVIGRGLQQVLMVQFSAPAYAWHRDQDTPELRPGPWPAQIMLARGMAVQPLVQFFPDLDGYLPVSGNIGGWDSRGPEASGLVCYAARWDPTSVTLSWLAFQVARILVGEVLSQEATPLSRAGRDFQAAALRDNRLPTAILDNPSPELLLLRAPVSQTRIVNGIEFNDD